MNQRKNTPFCKLLFSKSNLLLVTSMNKFAIKRICKGWYAYKGPLRMVNQKLSLLVVDSLKVCCLKIIFCYINYILKFYIISEGSLKKVSSDRDSAHQRYFILFNDMLLYCKVRNNCEPSQKSSLICSCVLPLRHCKAEAVIGNGLFKVLSLFKFT